MTAWAVAREYAWPHWRPRDAPHWRPRNGPVREGVIVLAEGRADAIKKADEDHLPALPDGVTRVTYTVEEIEAT